MMRAMRLHRSEFHQRRILTRTVIPRDLELSGATRASVRDVQILRAGGESPADDGVLLRRAAEVAPNVPPRETALFIVGTAPTSRQLGGGCQREVDRIRAGGLFAEVFNAYMEENR